MSPRLRAWAWLLFALAATAVTAVHFARGTSLQTNLLALLPATERDALAEQAAEALSAQLGSRAVFLVSHPDAITARDAARQFAAALAKDGAYRNVRAQLPTLDASLPFALYGPHRFGLLTDADRAQLSSGEFNLDNALARRLLAPVSDAQLTPLAQDPAGWLAHWLSSLPRPGGNLTLDDGYLVARDAQRIHVLVLAEPAGSPFDSTVQTRAVEAYDHALRAVQTAYPQTSVLHTGSVFYGAAARADAERDMNRIALISLIGISLMMLLVFRSLRPWLLGLLSVAIGIGVATGVILLTQGGLHLITLVFGASLIGEAIDYSIQYFAAQLHAGKDWQAQRGLALVRPALTTAVATSLIAYGLLGLLPFPAVSQIALFALLGLGAAYLSVICLLPMLLARPSRRDAEATTRWAGVWLARWCSLLAGRRGWLAAALALAVAVPGWFKLHADDDVRILIARPAELSQQEAQIRSLAGMDAGGRFFLIRGDTPEQVLEREASLTQRLRGLEQQGALAAHQAISDFVPPRAVQERDHALLAEKLFAVPAAFTATLTANGFRDEVTQQLLRDFANWTPLTIDAWLKSPLSAPYRHLWQPVGQQPASIVTLSGEKQPAMVTQATQTVPGVILVDKAGNTSAMLGQYRRWGGPALFAIAGVIGCVLAWRYGLRGAGRILLPVVLGELISLGVFGWLGAPVTLFAIMGWLLTLGIGVNYAIFLYEGIARASTTTAAVLLSAATTLLSFGLLAFSSMPALHQFGLALFAGITGAVLFAPLALASEHRP